MFSKKLFLLDGMALAYRAHFGFISRPMRNSRGMNTSALFGFTSTLVELLHNQKPTHIAIAFDTDAPTERHRLFPEYKANRQEIPEDLAEALPHLRDIATAFEIPILIKDGWEADDIIGTYAKRAEEAGGIETYMVTPDKDFGQLVSASTFVYRPSYKGDGAEIQGVREVCEKWGIQRVEQVIDMLGLCGDSSDNIPGIPGIGPKTAQKLIEQYGSIENLIERASELKGKQRERVETYADQAILSKKLATIDIAAPIDTDIDALTVKDMNRGMLKQLFAEYEFRTLSKRILGEVVEAAPAPSGVGDQLELIPNDPLNTVDDIKANYTLVDTDEKLADFLTALAKEEAVCFDLETDSLEPRKANIVGLAFSWQKHAGYYLPVAADASKEADLLAKLRTFFADSNVLKVGHNLKFDIAALVAKGIPVAGPFFDTQLAHALCEPEMRHGMDYLSEVFLRYKPIAISSLIGDKGPEQTNVRDVPVDKMATYATEDADVTWQLSFELKTLLREKAQEAVFHDVEMPLIPVLVAMEAAGVKVDASVLHSYAGTLTDIIEKEEAAVYELAGEHFMLSSPKQLGVVLFENLKLVKKPRKTRGGQYATDEQTLSSLRNEHEIIERILAYRAAIKLKNTYVDTLPNAIDGATGRVHTSYGQLLTATGRLQSNGPNLQNIPVRTELGREIRRAFIPEDGHVFLSADYSQIELRIIAALSGDEAMIAAFERGEDIHAATAAKIFEVSPEDVSREMRSKAKMVNFGIPYGISAFGLAQRLSCPRAEAKALIDAYFARFPKIQEYIDNQVSFCREQGFVQTVTGRRRYLPDINSRNYTTKSAAERNAINMPIQGTAADMIKLAMINVHRALAKHKLKAKLLLQVHDELVLEVPESEVDATTALVKPAMVDTVPLKVPIEIEVGTGNNWLEAH